jgi:MoxR-like ATPase
VFDVRGGDPVSEESAKFVRTLQELATEFEDLRQSRHEMGAEKYGHFSFLERDTIKDILEELADAANYLMYFYIKLRLIESNVDRVTPEMTDELGVKGFRTKIGG